MNEAFQKESSIQVREIKSMSLQTDIQKGLNELVETAQGVSSCLDEQEHIIYDSQEHSRHIDQTSQSSLEILRAIRSRRYRLWLWLKRQGKKLFGVATERTDGSSVMGAIAITPHASGSQPHDVQNRGVRGRNPATEESLEILKQISLEIGHSLDRQTASLETLSERTESSEDRFQRGIASAKCI